MILKNHFETAPSIPYCGLAITSKGVGLLRLRLVCNRPDSTRFAEYFAKREHPVFGCSLFIVWSR